MINVSYFCHWIKWERSFMLLPPPFITDARLLIWENEEGEERKRESNLDNKWRWQAPGLCMKRRHTEVLFRAGVNSRGKYRFWVQLLDPWLTRDLVGLEALEQHPGEQRCLWRPKGCANGCTYVGISGSSQSGWPSELVYFGGEMPAHSSHLHERSAEPFE